MTLPHTSPAAPQASSPQQDRQGAETTALRECAAFVGKLRRFLPAENDSPSVQSHKRAALASLRRGLGKAPGEAPEMYPYIIPDLPTTLSDRDEDAYFLIASLFAWHQGDLPYTSEAPRENRSFGASYRKLAERLKKRSAEPESANKTESESTEKRFIALLNAHRDDLKEHLRHAVGLLKANVILIDWVRLLYDVLRWDAINRKVQLSWAQGYWGTFSAPQAGANTTANSRQEQEKE